MSNLPFERKEYAARWEAAHAAMRQRQLEAAVVFGRSGGNLDRYQDIFYLTNYRVVQTYVHDGEVFGYRAVAHAAVVLELGKEPLLIASDPTVDPTCVATTRNSGDFDLIGELAKRLKQEGIRGRVGFVGSDTISAKHFQVLRELTTQIEWENCDDLILDTRIIKSPAELDACRYGGQTYSRALSIMFEALQMGASESDAAGEAAREIFRREGQVTHILVSHGPQTADRLTDNPLVGYSTAKPQSGDIVRGWIYGAAYQGYHLDPGRTTVIGLRPSADQKHLVESCADIVEKCRGAIRAGVGVRDVAALGVRLRRDFGGVEDEMSTRWPLFGHGNGLFFEPPTITPEYAGKHQVFREGMVASTEAFLAIPGVGGAGFEQNFIVTKEGTELLTTTPMIWWQ